MIDINKAKVSSFAKDKTIYLAGGCFWGIQYYFSKLNGVTSSLAGYSNGKTANTSYYEIDSSGHAEVVKIDYDPFRISLEEILVRFFRIIDPTQVNRQGNDFGSQYRSGVYYTKDDDFLIINKVINFISKDFTKKIATEVKKVENFVLAEEYHQDYLIKNEAGYCSIDKSSLTQPIFNRKFPKPTKKELKERLSDIQYSVTQENDTEYPTTGKYDQEFQKGLYVDIVSGEPLFLSDDKFDAGCGWPSFTKPIFSYTLAYLFDSSRGRQRVEVRGEASDSHLGHVFDDGIEERGGLRYCINSASLRFIPYNQLEKYNYKEYAVFFR